MSSGAEPTLEELLKVWAFRRALGGLRSLDAGTLTWLAQRCPSLGRASVLAASSADASAPEASTPSPHDTVVAFLQAAAVHVTGRNMDALNGPALLVFGVLVKQRESVKYMDDDRAATSAGPPSTNESADGAAAVPPPPSKPASKPPSKSRLLSALAAMRFEEEPPKERSRALPADLQFDLDRAADEEARRLARASNAARRVVQQADREPAASTKPAKASKKARPEGSSTQAAENSAGGEDEAAHVNDSLEVAEDATSAGAVALKSRRAPRAQRAAAGESGSAAVDASDAAAIAPAVMRLVQVLTVTTGDVVVDKLRGQNIEATRLQVDAAVQRLAAQELVVVEHGIIYPLG